MRLIDADKITFFDCLSKSGNTICCHAKGITCKEGIDMQPTVKAITAEWITNWLIKQTIPATSYGLDCSAVEKMLEDWEKENAKAD